MFIDKKYIVFFILKYFMYYLISNQISDQLFQRVLEDLNALSTF